MSEENKIKVNDLPNEQGAQEVELPVLNNEGMRRLIRATSGSLQIFGLPCFLPFSETVRISAAAVGM